VSRGFSRSRRTGKSSGEGPNDESLQGSGPALAADRKEYQTLAQGSARKVLAEVPVFRTCGRRGSERLQFDAEPAHRFRG